MSSRRIPKFVAVVACLGFVLACNGASSPPKVPADEAVFIHWLAQGQYSQWDRVLPVPGVTILPPEEWVARGRRLPHITDALIDHLNREDLSKPSIYAVRMVMALGDLGDRRPDAVRAIIRVVHLPDTVAQMEALTALRKQVTPGDMEAAHAIEDLMLDEDSNVRVNACETATAIGVATPRIGAAFKQLATDPNESIAECAKTALTRLGVR